MESQSQQHGSKYFACRTPPPLALSKGQNSTFSEHGHVGYQIQGNDACSNMVANILLADPHLRRPPGWDQKVKIQLFQNMVMLHIKLKECYMQQHGNKNILAAEPPPPSPSHPGGQKVKIRLFQNMVLLHIKLKEIMNAATW